MTVVMVVMMTLLVTMGFVVVMVTLVTVVLLVTFVVVMVVTLLEMTFLVVFIVVLVTLEIQYFIIDDRILPIQSFNTRDLLHIIGSSHTL